MTPIEYKQRDFEKYDFSGEIKAIWEGAREKYPKAFPEVLPFGWTRIIPGAEKNVLSDLKNESLLFFPTGIFLVESQYGAIDPLKTDINRLLSFCTTVFSSKQSVGLSSGDGPTVMVTPLNHERDEDLDIISQVLKVTNKANSPPVEDNIQRIIDRL